MTNAEIVKAIKCCMLIDYSCDECPYYPYGSKMCNTMLYNDVMKFLPPITQDDCNKMSDRETIIKACENWVNNHKNENFLLTYSSVVELLTILKEQEAAYQGAEELLRQTTILFGDAIKRLKEQDEQIKNRDESLEKAREEIKWLRGMLKEQEVNVNDRSYS